MLDADVAEMVFTQRNCGSRRFASGILPYLVSEDIAGAQSVCLEYVIVFAEVVVAQVPEV